MMKNVEESPILYFIHDPMCSWCWGFKKTWLKIQEQLNPTVSIRQYVGGLAPDNDDPMPMEMQEKLEQTWKRVEAHTGASFNYDFWRNNTPQRSTYPACRAVICASRQNQENEMITAIQHVYYQEAQNPSLMATLEQLAAKIGLDVKNFKKDMCSDDVNKELKRQIHFARSIGGDSFPSLFLQLRNSKPLPLPLNYVRPDTTLRAINDQL